MKRLPHGLEAVDVAVEAAANLGHLTLALLAGALTLRLRGAVLLQGGHVGLELLREVVDRGVAVVLHLLLLHLEFGAQFSQILVATLFVDLGDHVGGEVDDLLEVLGREVEHVARREGTPLKYQMCVTGAARSM